MRFRLPTPRHLLCSLMLLPAFAFRSRCRRATRRRRHRRAHRVARARASNRTRPDGPRSSASRRARTAARGRPGSWTAPPSSRPTRHILVDGTGPHHGWITMTQGPDQVVFAWKGPGHDRGGGRQDHREAVRGDLEDPFEGPAATPAPAGTAVHRPVHLGDRVGHRVEGYDRPVNALSLARAAPRPAQIIDLSARPERPHDARAVDSPSRRQRRRSGRPPRGGRRPAPSRPSTRPIRRSCSAPASFPGRRRRRPAPARSAPSPQT